MSNFEMLRDKLLNLPQEPGIYMMRDSAGTVIYVGKAKILRNRVRSYFSNAKNKDNKTLELVRWIRDFDITITSSEEEALLLERTLIKQHNPRFNIIFKDGKEYPFLRIDFQEPWPRIEKVRKREADGAYYVGPFSYTGHLNSSLKLAGRIFPLIRCSRHEFKNAKRPCNYYHIKMCLGQCTIPADRDQYVLMLKDALSFLLGKNQELAKQLEARMLAHAEANRFENAALIRDQLIALERLNSKQTVVAKDVEDADALAFEIADGEAAACVVSVRNSRVIGSESFIVRVPVDAPAQLLETFLMQYYESRMLPPMLLLQNIEGADPKPAISALATQQSQELRGKQPHIFFPERGTKKDLVAMALKNAVYALEESQRTDKQKKSDLAALQKLLELDDLPNEMECIDISNLQGTSMVASVVHFSDGKPNKKLYRTYKIRSLDEGEQNDFAAIKEVVTRRLRSYQENGESLDLLIIDGGKGQLQSALAAASEYGGLKLPIVSLAKSRLEGFSDDQQKAHRSFERVFTAKNDVAIALRQGSPEFRLLTAIRDEAHRFAITAHRRQRAKKMVQSGFEDITGISGALRRQLKLEFFDVTQVIAASDEKLASIPMMSARALTAIKNFKERLFKEKEEDELKDEDAGTK